MKTNVIEEQGIKVIQNKFGEISVNLGNAIYCPYGLVGMPEQISFALANCPIEKFATFKLFQSLIDETLVFMVLPLDLENPIIAKEDLLEAFEIAGVEEKDAGIVLIASTKELEEGKVITVNARAPIIIDAKNKAAIQFVLPNTDYDVQHII